MKLLSFLIFFSGIPFFSVAQGPTVADCVQRLKDNSDTQFLQHYAMYLDIQKLDTPSRVKMAFDIEKACASGNRRLRLLGRSVKAKLLFYSTTNGDAANAAEMKKCLVEATEMDEPYLQAEFGRWYSEMLNSLDQKELAVQYAVTSLKLHEYLGFQKFRAVSIFYMWVGETLLMVDYVPEAIYHLQKGLELAKGDTLVRPFRYMFTYNNLGLAYRQLNRHDSALYYFEKLKAYCAEIDRPVWEKIAYKNRLPSFVALHMLDSAKVVADSLFIIAKTSKDPDDETIAWYMQGQIAMQENNYQQAVQHLLHGISASAGKYPKQENRINEALVKCYEAMGQPEKAYPYLKAVRHYEDSVDLARTNYNTRFLSIKADYEKEQLAHRDIVARGHRAIRFRNWSIGLLVALSILGIAWINRRRRRAQEAQQQGAVQLELFKKEMIDKNARIEELLAGIEEEHHRQLDAEHLEELSRQMILTEDDWQNFKRLFEKVHPSFFSGLKQKAPGITEAEQRMAALLRIQLNTKQIAAMQGISPDSVHKTRHRLRQRFGTGSTTELENIIAGI